VAKTAGSICILSCLIAGVTPRHTNISCVENSSLNSKLGIRQRDFKCDLGCNNGGGGRVPELPIRDCARGCNNREHTRTQLSAIDVRKNTFFERLYLVLGMHTFALWSTVPMHPQLQPFTRQLFLDLCAIFPPNGAPFFLVSTIHQVIWPSPGTLGGGGNFSRVNLLVAKCLGTR